MKKGFTLIELLVVIAIIGILSSVVLASLNTARDKGSDASGKSSLASMRAEAELVADGGSYADVCTTGQSSETLYQAAVDAVSGTAGTDADCFADADGWVSYITLSTDDVFCADSSGYSGVASTTPTDADSRCTD